MSAPPRDLIGWLDYYLATKAPFQLPANVREVLARAAPWIALVLLILSLGPALHFLGIRGGWRWFHRDPYFMAGIRVIGIAYLVYVALLFLALPGLFNRRASGWSLALYAELWSILISVVLVGNIIGGLLGGLIALYLLFQIRPYFQGTRSQAN